MAAVVKDVAKGVVNKATGKSTKIISVPLEFGSEHGHQIFVYHNLLTKQVIYSLTRSMKNTLALHQLPFLGKKSRPAALRKDHWTPLCVLSFLSPNQGLNAYTKLREFRHLHELSWNPQDMLKNDGRSALTKRERTRKLMGQKENSIADMAAVLSLQARPPTTAEVEKAKFFVRTDGRPLAKRGKGSRVTHDVLEWQGRVKGTSVWWADMLDAEYAERWPVAVEHGRLAVMRGTVVWPPPEELVKKEIEVEVEGEEKEEGWEESVVEEKREERRRLLRRGSGVDIKVKIREAEEWARRVEARRVEERETEEGEKEGVGEEEKEKGKGGWFESTRRLFPIIGGRRTEGTMRSAPPPAQAQAPAQPQAQA